MIDVPRILLIAPYADPDDVGEGWSTFQWLKGITAAFSSVTILGMHRKGRSIEKRFPHHRVISWPEISFFSKYERFNSMFLPSYFSFFFSARKWLKKETINGKRWDLIHQLCPLALRYPSPVYDLAVPYIIGPLAGSIKVPKGFKDELRTRAWYTKLNVLDDMRFRYDPLLRRTYQNSTLVLGVAPYVKDLLADVAIKDFAIVNETGVYSTKITTNKRDAIFNDPFRLLHVGRIVRSKGLRDIIRALGIVKNRTEKRFILNVLGDGEDRSYCEREARKLGIDNQVVFHGIVAREKVDQFYKDADLFVFPSIKEPSGNVILEAMSFGLPMIVCENGGPGYTVKDSFGIKLAADSPLDYAERLADSIITLFDSPGRLLAMRDAAIREVEANYLWPNKITSMIRIYNSILNKISIIR